MINITVKYTTGFVRQYTKLSIELREEVREKIELLKESKNNEKLKVHKLKGRLSGRYSFSVNYKYRIMFEYIDKKNIVLLTIGDHDIYL